MWFTRTLLCGVYYSISEIHGTEHDRNNIHHPKEFTLHLIGTTKNMRIILCKATYTGQAVKLAALLITAHRTELSNTQRQILVRSWEVLIDFAVMRTVHRFQEILLSFFRSMDRLESILTIVLPPKIFLL